MCSNLYYFTKDNHSLRANHAGELPYAYGNLWRHDFVYEDSDRELSEIMTNYWANFVKTGNPNGEGIFEWPLYADAPGEALELGEKISMVEDPFLALYDIIDRYQDSLEAK